MSRLLIVEDEPALAGVLAEHFKNRGYQVDLAYEFEAAAALLTKVEYDLLLTDLRLDHEPAGGMHASASGVEGFVLVLETRTLHPNLPVIMLTGYESAQIKDWTLSYPHSAFLRKPISLAELEANVCGLLAQTQ